MNNFTCLWSIFAHIWHVPVKPYIMHTVNEKMSKLAKNNAKCEIFVRYAEISSKDSIDMSGNLGNYHEIVIT